MVEIVVPGCSSVELWDPVKEEFVSTKEEKAQTLRLEHSLLSISKWESKWHKPFLSDKPKTSEETIDYIRCMALNKDISDSMLQRIPKSEMKKIEKYIQDPMTATWFSNKEEKKPVRKQTVTAEILYYDMIALGIPFECEKWHINRLITLIRVCQEKQDPQRKMTTSERTALNKSRRAARRSRG